MTTEEMYSMNETLKGKTNMSIPKKENMFYSVFNALNTFWERFSRVSTSFLTGINYPLSITVVHNEGILSQELYENFTPKKEMLNADNVYIHNNQLKKSLNIIENIPHEVFDDKISYMNRILNETTKDNLKFNYAYIDGKNENENVNRSDNKESIAMETVKNNTINCNYLLPIEDLSKRNTKPAEYICSEVSSQDICIRTNTDNYEDIYNIVSNKNHDFNHTDNIMDDMVINLKESVLSISDSNIISVQPTKQVTASNMLTNAWQRACDGVTDQFSGTDAIEAEIAMKRSSLSPKQRRKYNTITKGRGRGRAKSQLRRSGVSQTRHRKERTKHELEADIQSDLRNWQESEMCHDTKENCFSLDEDVVDGEIVCPAVYTIADVQSKAEKPKTCNLINQRISKFSTRMGFGKPNIYHEEYIENKFTVQRNTLRPRLMSESSIDSEDSYYIAFEVDSETACQSDLEYTDESETDQNVEDENACENEETVSRTQKVKFNLKPIVHIMVQWDYAYRAARKGPWEEMVRDRDRFRSRIKCIEHVLNPILTSQHRTHIWQERFALTESNSRSLSS